MKKIIAGIIAFTLLFGSTIIPESFDNVFDMTIKSSAATDAWGREYLTYGDFKYQVKSDNTISIIGFDISKDIATIPDKIGGKPVTEIGRYAFSSAYFIETIDIPDTVTSIKDKAFSYCTSLKSINIPKGVITIGNYAFENCESLQKISIPNTVTSIGEYAFTYTALKSVSIPDSVKTIKYRAFFCCSDLISVRMPSNLSALGNDIFGYCSKLETVNIPTNITAIPERLFFRCTNLKNVTIPEGITSIDKMAFYYCESLEAITIPGSVKTIGESAFQNCSSLATVNISEGVTTLGKYVFQNCSALTEFVLPNSVTSAGNFCFAHCPSLTLYVYKDSYGVEFALKQLSLNSELNFTTIPYFSSASEVTGFRIDANSTGSIRVVWEEFEGVDGYIIYKYDSAKKANVRVGKTSDCIFSVKGLASGTTYKLYVKAYKASGNGYIYGNAVSLTACTKPATPAAKMALNSSSSVRLSWNKITGAGGYIIEQYKNGSWVRISKITSPSTLVYSVKGLASGTTYKFRIKAYKMLGSKAYYSGYSSTVTTCTKPATPTAKMALNSTSSIRLSWNKITGAGGYIIEQYKNGSWVRIAKITSPSTLVYSVKGLKRSTSYKFRIKSYKMLGSKAYYSSYYTLTARTK